MEAGDRDFALPFTHSEYLTRNKYGLTVIEGGLYKVFLWRRLEVSNKEFNFADALTEG